MGKAAPAETVDEREMAEEAATAVRAAPVLGANAFLTASETVAPAALPDPEAPAELVVEEGMVATVARKDISPSLCPRGITTCHTSEPLAAQVAEVAAEVLAWGELEDRRERPEAAEAAVISRVATDVTEQMAQLVSQVFPDDTV